MTEDELEFDRLLVALRRANDDRADTLEALAKISAGIREIEDRLNTLLRQGTTVAYVHGYED